MFGEYYDYYESQREREDYQEYLAEQSDLETMDIEDEDY